MAGASEDDIIRCKLLVEGDGGNDDRRIGTLLRTFTKWVQTPEYDEDSELTYQKMLSVLSQCEMAALKSYRVCEMNKREQDNYTHLSKTIENEIVEAQEEIERCKKELQKTRFIRRNRQEYDALSKVIQQHPDRLDTLRQLDELDKEMKDLMKSKSQLQEKLELRQKQFHLLNVAIHGLQKILDDDEEEGRGDQMDRHNINPF